MWFACVPLLVLLLEDFAQQCFITSEPIAARKKGADPAVFLVADEGFNPYLVIAITRKSLWTEKPDLVRTFRRAALEGWRADLDDAGPGNTIIAKLNTSLEAEALPLMAAAQKPLIETEETRKKGLGTMSRERWETMTKQLVELGIIDRAPPVDDYLVAFE
ncbi:ABC transporter substrate-binding protein [Sorangium sp. So ce1128]